MYGNGDVMKYLEWTESEGKREKVIEREGTNNCAERKRKRARICCMLSLLLFFQRKMKLESKINKKKN